MWVLSESKQWWNLHQISFTTLQIIDNLLLERPNICFIGPYFILSIFIIVDGQKSKGNIFRVSGSGIKSETTNINMVIHCTEKALCMIGQCN